MSENNPTDEEKKKFQILPLISYIAEDVTTEFLNKMNREKQMAQ
jgi:hypothetical protein